MRFWHLKEYQFIQLLFYLFFIYFTLFIICLFFTRRPLFVKKPKGLLGHQDWQASSEVGYIWADAMSSLCQPGLLPGQLTPVQRWDKFPGLSLQQYLVSIGSSSLLPTVMLPRIPLLAHPWGLRTLKDLFGGPAGDTGQLGRGCPQGGVQCTFAREPSEWKETLATVLIIEDEKATSLSDWHPSPEAPGLGISPPCHLPFVAPPPGDPPPTPIWTPTWREVAPTVTQRSPHRQTSKVAISVLVSSSAGLRVLARAVGAGRGQACAAAPPGGGRDLESKPVRKGEWSSVLLKLLYLRLILFVPVVSEITWSNISEMPEAI